MSDFKSRALLKSIVFFYSVLAPRDETAVSDSKSEVHRYRLKITIDIS